MQLEYITINLQTNSELKIIISSDKTIKIRSVNLSHYEATAANYEVLLYCPVTRHTELFMPVRNRNEIEINCTAVMNL